MKNLKNKVAVITGGASGMGLAFAHRFAAAGMSVAIADIEEAAPASYTHLTLPTIPLV